MLYPTKAVESGKALHTKLDVTMAGSEQPGVDL